MSDVVWACDYLGKSELDSDFSPDMGGRDWQAVNKLIHMVVNAHPLEASQFPTTVYASNSRPQKPQHVANMGLFAYSPQVIELLSAFDLGKAKFHAPSFISKDTKTELELDHAFVEYGNVKTSFSISQSRNCEELPTHSNPELANYRYPPGYVKDGDLALTPDSLNGPEIWVEKHLIRMVFVSDRIAQALRDTKLDAPFFLRRCRIVES